MRTQIITPQSQASNVWTLAAAIALTLLMSYSVKGQDKVDSLLSRIPAYDPDFPERKRFNVGTMVTYSNLTPPPAIVGEVTYGFSRKFSAGILAGTTGTQILTGVKLNTVLFRNNSFSLMNRIVILYYPGRSGRFLFDTSHANIMPWMLSMATLDATYLSKNGTRWLLGVGVLETHCVEGMKDFFFGSSEERFLVPFEFFHTVQTSVSIPVSKRWLIGPDIIFIMQKGSLIRQGEFRVFPIHPFARVVYKL